MALELVPTKYQKGILNREQIIKLIDDDPKITNEEIGKYLKVGIPQVKKYIGSMLKSGILTSIKKYQSYNNGKTIHTIRTLTACNTKKLNP